MVGPASVPAGLDNRTDGGDGDDGMGGDVTHTAGQSTGRSLNYARWNRQRRADDQMRRTRPPAADTAVGDGDVGGDDDTGGEDVDVDAAGVPSLAAKQRRRRTVKRVSDSDDDDDANDDDDDGNDDQGGDGSGGGVWANIDAGNATDVGGGDSPAAVDANTGVSSGKRKRRRSVKLSSLGSSSHGGSVVTDRQGKAKSSASMTRRDTDGVAVMPTPTATVLLLDGETTGEVTDMRHSALATPLASPVGQGRRAKVKASSCAPLRVRIVREAPSEDVVNAAKRRGVLTAVVLEGTTGLHVLATMQPGCGPAVHDVYADVAGSLPSTAAGAGVPSAPDASPSTPFTLPQRRRGRGGADDALLLLAAQRVAAMTSPTSRRSASAASRSAFGAASAPASATVPCDVLPTADVATDAGVGSPVAALREGPGGPSDGSGNGGKPRGAVLPMLASLAVVAYGLTPKSATATAGDGVGACGRATRAVPPPPVLFPAASAGAGRSGDGDDADGVPVPGNSGGGGAGSLPFGSKLRTLGALALTLRQLKGGAAQQQQQQHPPSLVAAGNGEGDDVLLAGVARPSAKRVRFTDDDAADAVVGASAPCEPAPVKRRHAPARRRHGQQHFLSGNALLPFMLPLRGVVHDWRW